MRKPIWHERKNMNISNYSSPPSNYVRQRIEPRFISFTIKAGEKLSEIECIELVDQLFNTKHPYYCPHGRPIIINLSIDDLPKKHAKSNQSLIKKLPSFKKSKRKGTNHYRDEWTQFYNECKAIPEFYFDY